LGFIVGPQLNAASRIEDSSLPSKLLISEDLVEIESISKKLFLLNEKRKLIENNIYKQVLDQVTKQNDQKFILVYDFGWHNGVLGIIASRLVEKYNKPSIVISMNNNIGIGSARSIEQIDLGNIIINAKNAGILISGGGHKMAAGLKIENNSINLFNNFLIKYFKRYQESIFEKIDLYDIKLSINEINLDLLESLEKLEPFGNGNEQPKFIIQDIRIDKYKIIKEKHILMFFKSDLGKNIRGISFNSVDTELGENIINNKFAKYEFGCTVKRDKLKNDLQPQLIIKDAIIVN